MKEERKDGLRHREIGVLENVCACACRCVRVREERRERQREREKEMS